MNIKPLTMIGQSEYVDLNVEHHVLRVMGQHYMLETPRKFAGDLNELYGGLFNTVDRYADGGPVERAIFFHVVRRFWLDIDIEPVVVLGRADVDMTPRKIYLPHIGWLQIDAVPLPRHAVEIGVTLKDRRWVYIERDQLPPCTVMHVPPRPKCEMIKGLLHNVNHPVLPVMRDDPEQYRGHIDRIGPVINELLFQSEKQTYYDYYNCDRWIIPITAEWDRVAMHWIPLIGSKLWEEVENKTLGETPYGDVHHFVAQALVFGTRWCTVSRVVDAQWAQPGPTFMTLFMSYLYLYLHYDKVSTLGLDDEKDILLVDSVIWFFQDTYMTLNGNLEQPTIELRARCRPDEEHVACLKSISQFEDWINRVLGLGIRLDTLP